MSIVIRRVNQAPVCLFTIGGLLKLTPDVTENIVIACDNISSATVLDASLSTDADSANLTYLWLVDDQPAGMGKIVTNTLSVGTHKITLIVDDGGQGTDPSCAGNGGTSTCEQMVTVIDGCEVIEEIVLMVEQSNVSRKVKRPLTQHLKDACKAFDQGKCKDGVKKLVAFQEKVRKGIEDYAKGKKDSIDPVTGEKLIRAAQAVIDAYAPCACAKRATQR